MSRGWVMQYKTTKEEQFDEIYRTYQNDVYKISLYYTNDEYTAQDITQNVFLRFYCHFENTKIESIRAYLLRSARNLSFNWLRDQKRGIKGEYIENIPEERVPQYNVEHEYIKEEQNRANKAFLDRVMTELQQENESWYDILNLIYCLEKSHEEVCDELDLTRDVLYSKIYRAKRWIRKKYEKEYEQL